MSETPKAIGSLAKKQQDVTRQGTQKLKFVPTLPARRKKEEVKPESPPSILTAGTGRNVGIGKGQGRGIQRKSVEMTASGPFAMGPALSGNASRRPVARFGVTPPATPPTCAPTAKATSVSVTTPSLKHSGLEHQSQCSDPHEDEEFFSDEGVEVIDLQSIQKLDWTAPESLRKSQKAEKWVKQERHEGMSSDNMINRSDELHTTAGTNHPENLILGLQTQSLFSIQFPAPFPIFSPTTDPDSAIGRKVTFASDIEPSAAPGSTTRTEQLNENRVQGTVDGVIGQLELYRNGAIKIRLPNGILFDMKPAAQLVFPEQAVILNHAENRIVVLGETDKRYMVSPDVDTLLAGMDVGGKEIGATNIQEEDLVRNSM